MAAERPAPSQAPASGAHATPKQVMHIITKGEHGGAQTHVRTLCQALAARVAFSAVIGGPDVQPPLERELHALGLPVYRVPSLLNSLAPWHLYRSVVAVHRLIRAHDPDVLHAHSAVAAVVARIAGRLSRTPVVYTVHGFAFKPEAPRGRRTVAWCCEWLLAPWTTRMVCVSRHEQHLARRLPIPKERQAVVPNAIEDSPYRAHGSPAPLSIVMVARLAAPKRPDLLLHAMARLRDALGQEVPTCLIGDGPDRAALEALAAQLRLQRLVFAGEADDVPRRLAEHSIFVLLSDHEGLPISVIEAMRAGLPIVASDLPGLGELMPSPEQGFRVPNEPGAIAAALEQLARSPALRERLGQAARARYEQAYTPERMASSILAIYDEALP